jgi:competence CoiA-like predicted nuclease
MPLKSSDRSYTCKQVFDQDKRSIRDVWEVLDTEYEAEQFQLRMKVEEEKKSKGFRFTCPLCNRGLNLRGGGDQKKTLHFTHPREPEHRCPYKTEDNHSPEDIEAMKYNGAKESIEHLQVKKRLIVGLHLDPDAELSSVKSEETFRANLPDKSWRRPDVSVRWKGQSIVFEAQLSTTFLSVIAGRRTFYCQNQAQLIWVFAQAPDSGEMPFTHKDIFHNNNHNLFLVNSATEDESLARRCLIIEAWWPDPLQYLRHKAATHWHRKMVALSELTFDLT